MDRVYDFSEILEATNLTDRTVRKYLKELNVKTRYYSVGKIQISQKDFDRLLQYIQEKAEQLSELRRNNLAKVAPYNRKNK